MSTAAHVKPNLGASPRLKARIAGGLYVFSLATAATFETFVHGKLNIVGGLVAVAGMVALTLLLYVIFKPVSNSVSLLAACVNLVGLTFEALRLNPRGVDVALVFAGTHAILIGYLIFRSIFLPRFLGALMAIAGLAWLTYVSTPLAVALSPYNVACGVIGELSVMLWLLVMGVNAQRWNEQADAMEAPARAQRW